MKIKFSKKNNKITEENFFDPRLRDKLKKLTDWPIGWLSGESWNQIFREGGEV